MYLWGTFLTVALLAGCASAATLSREIREAPVATFTSELGEGFHITEVRDKDQDDDDKENALDHVVGNKEVVKSSPSVVANEEKQIPVKVVRDPAIATKIEEPLKEQSETVKDEKNEKVQEKKEVVKKDVQVSKEDEVVDKKEEIKVVEKPVQVVLDEKVEVEKVPLDSQKHENCDKDKEVPAEENKNEANVGVKSSLKNVEKQSDSVANPESAPSSDPVATVTPAPSVPQNIFQQTFDTISQGIQSIVAVVRPANASSPNIFQTLQQGIQNIISGPQAANLTAADPPNIFAGIQSFTNMIQSSIQNLTSAVFNRNATSGSSNLIQTGVANLQAAISTGVQTLNQTIQSAINPQGPGLVQTGITTIQQGVQNISTGVQNFLSPQNDDASPQGVIQQTVQNISLNLQSGVQRLNSTIQDIITPAEGQRPTIIQSGIMSLQTGLQNLLRRNESTTVAPSTSRQEVLKKFQEELESLEQTLKQGVESLKSDAQSIVDQQPNESLPVEAKKPVDAKVENVAV